MEPTIKAHGAMAYGVDVLVKAPGGNILACVEVKRSVSELRKLKRDFSQCCHRGDHTKEDCAFQQNHPKYAFCAHYKPNYFWAVAPGEEACFGLGYCKGTIQLKELRTLPDRSMVERNAHLPK